MPLSLPAGIRDVTRPERRCSLLDGHAESNDLNFGAPECLLRGPEHLGPGSSEDGLDCTTEGINTHKTEAQEVRYAWHPWYGRLVTVRGIRNRHGLKVLFCTVDDEHEFPVLEVPEWMFDPNVCGRLGQAEKARVDAQALRGLKSLLESSTPRPEPAVLEAQHHPQFSGGADANEAKEVQVEPIRVVPSGSAESGSSPGSSSEDGSSLGTDAASPRGQSRQSSARPGGEP
jgi:hypothetical protein